MHKILTPKILLPSLFVILSAGHLFAQPKTIDSKSFNLLGLSDYFISGTSTGNTYVFKLYSFAKGPNDESNISFTLRPMTKESFIKNFFSSYAKFQSTITSTQRQIPQLAQNISYKVNKNESDKSEAYKEIEAEATKLFYLFIAQSIVVDDLGNEPIAGTICYVDSLLVLRRDINDHPFRGRVNRLWKMYKQDRKVVRALQRNGALDQYIGLKERILLEQLSPETLKALAERDASIEDTISGRFTFLEIDAHLKRGKFKRKKEAEFLRARANDLKDQYEVALNEFDENAATLQTNRDSLKAYQEASQKISLIRRYESGREKLTQAFEKISQNDQFLSKLLGKAQAINVQFHGLMFDKGPEKETAKQMERKLLAFDQTIQSLTCQEEIGKEWHKQVNSEIENWETYFTTAVGREKQALVIANSSDSSGIEQNIRIFEAILKIIKDLPQVENPKVCKSVKDLDTLNLQQDELLEQIALEFIKDSIKSIVTSRNRPMTIDKTKITVNNNGGPRSVVVKQRLKLELDQIAITTKRLQDSINLHESLQEDKILQIAKLEDQQLFKAFKLDSIVIEIKEGFIENILMVGKVKEYTDKYGYIKVGKDGKATSISRPLEFGNSSPIGFSRKLDFDLIKGKKLYTKGGDRTQYETALEDVLRYVQEHEVGRRDYSPANQKVVLKKKSIEQASLCRGLKKEATYQLFEAKVFSDFVGLDETEPNGLIQTEISKRINLRTSRSPFRPFAVRGLKDEWNFGFLAFFEPVLVLSKVENNNKFLTLDNKDRFVNNQYTPIKFASTLDLKRFENFSAGATANLLLIDVPNIKSTFFVNWGFRYGRTGIQDSVRTATNGTVQVNQEGIKEFGVNTFEHAPEFVWSIYADERYGFSMSWQHHWFYLRDNRFEQVSNTSFFEDQLVNNTRASRQFNTVRFITTLEQSANNKGRLFFRYTYNWQQGFWRTGFHQAQVGYSFYLLGRKAD